MEQIFADLGAVLRGARKGAHYGLKIRIPHAFVMTFLFREGTVRDKLRSVLEMGLRHARNLALFATVYKSLTLAMARLAPGLAVAHAGGSPPHHAGGSPRHHAPREAGSPHKADASCPPPPSGPGSSARPAHHGGGYPAMRPAATFLAGAAAGYAVFHDPSSLNQQIILYLFSRVAMGALRTLHARGVLPDPTGPRAWPLVAAAVWGAVMTMFENGPGALQASLLSSMEFIYH
jgi:peroxisomal membrane protein 4